MEEIKKKTKKVKKELSLKAKILRTIFVAVIIAGLITLGYFILVWTGVWEKINSVEKLRDVILSWGFWGRLGFVAIQFLQVTFLPLPSTVTVIAGALVYGPLQASLLSLAGILLGSIFAFFLGRVFGKKLVEFMVGEKTCAKWTKFLSDAKYSFFIMMLLPIFPDDVLCLVAGLTNMSWAFFTITNLICRPIGILTVSYFGSGTLIPYHGWGLVAWAFIIAGIIVLIVLSYKYQKQIENFILKIFRKKTMKNKSSTMEVQTASMEEKSEKEDDKNINELKARCKSSLNCEAGKEIDKHDKIEKTNEKNKTD